VPYSRSKFGFRCNDPGDMHLCVGSARVSLNPNVAVTVREPGKHRAAEGKYLIAEDNPISGGTFVRSVPSGSHRQHHVVRPFVLHERIQPRLPVGP